MQIKVLGFADAGVGGCDGGLDFAGKVVAFGVGGEAVRGDVVAVLLRARRRRRLRRRRTGG